VSRFLCPAGLIIGHFADESFQAIICTDTDNSKQTRKKYIKKHTKIKINKVL